MNLLKKIIYIASFLLVACATTTAPIVLKGTAFEQKNLVDAVGNQRVAIKGNYISRRWSGEYTTQDHCSAIEQKRLFETTVAAWAPNQTDGTTIKPTDIVMSYTWTCDNIYTDSAGGSAVASLFTLGMLPVKSEIRLRFSVRISKGSKDLFKGFYEKRDVIETGLSNKSFNDGIKAHFLAMANLHMETFIKELDRDGALDR